MRYEKPQKGNPHNLTINQHTFPKASIMRFAANDGTVSVFYIPGGKYLQLSPDDHLFCVKRTWDQRAEKGYMKDIEDKFQNLAEGIINQTVSGIGLTEKEIVDDFFALWNIRAHWKFLRIPDLKLNGIVGLKCNFTKDEQELLEKRHITFVKPELTFPGRQITGIKIQRNIDLARRQLADSRWGILRAADGEFIVPDYFSNARIIPLTPTLCLFSRSEGDVISGSEVLEINRLACDSSREYYFARDISKCPL